MQQLAKAKESTGAYHAASEFRSLQVCTMLQVAHDPEESIWNRLDIDDVPSAITLY
jgi:hypothetical protein